ncbi:MAG: phage terminase large subunit family protein [Deltaproteobacteria bacterium]|nr:phage terminase large subunit family protein [Deltaproteobacteria bacterium]
MLKETLRAKASSRLAPPPKLTISEWADRYRKLSRESSAEPGQWKTDRAPYQKSMMDAVSNPRVRTIVLMTASQIGKSCLLENVIGYFICYDPSPILLVQPTLQMSQAFSKDRLSPLARDTPILHGKLQHARTKDGSNTVLHKTFPGGHITLSGANSPASLASRPIRILLCDEVDRWPLTAGTEGSPLHIAAKRTVTFYNRKHVFASTPGNSGESIIADEWELSNKQRYHVPCPHCEHYQTLEWKNVKWIKDGDIHKPETAYYECESCQGRISEVNKQVMLRRGKWVAEHPEVLERQGFHINELYSPWRRWSQVVSDFLASKDHPEKLKVWVNTSLGLPFQYKSDEHPEWRSLYSRRENYTIGTAPAACTLLTAGVDVQADRLECTVIGWKDSEAFVIDHIVFPGRTSDIDSPCWTELDALLAKTWEKANGSTLRIRRMAIDSGYNTSTVYAYCQKKPSARVLAIRGLDSLDVPIGTPRRVYVRSTGKRSRSLLLWGLGVSIIKSDLYSRLSLPAPTEEEIEKNGFPSQYIHFPELGQTYFQQLTGETCALTTDAHGRPKYTWRKIHPEVEALDCFVYAMAMQQFRGAKIN